MFEQLKRLAQQLNSERIAKTMFVIGFGFLTYFYGIATYYFEVFPYPILRDARDAWESLNNMEPDLLPIGFLEYATGVDRKPPIRSLDDRAGSERLLITGGFYQMQDHCPNFGCIAWIMDRDGNILHTWETDPNELLQGVTNISGPLNALNLGIGGIALLKDGGLVVVFHGRNTWPYQTGVAQFDVDGNVIWKRFDLSHHWPTVDKDGQIYVAYMEIVENITYFADTPTKLKCDSGKTLVDGVRVLAQDGTVKRDFNFLDLFNKANYPGLFFSETMTGIKRWDTSNCDPFHMNAIEIVTEAAAAQLENVDAGDLLVSLRTRSILAVLDRLTGAIKYLTSGRTSAQHSPRFLPDGTLLVFDNRGGKREYGGSRIARLDLESNVLTTVFPQGDEGDMLPFYSADEGVLSLSEDGQRVLASVTGQGRVIEVDIKSGDALWVYENIIDMEPFHEAAKIETEQTLARFTTKGAYYIEGTSFLDTRIPNEIR